MRRRSATATVFAVLAMVSMILAEPAAAVPAGELDPTFGANGIVVMNLSDPPPGPPCLGAWVFRCGLPAERVLDAIGRPDGSVVVVTAFADTHLALLRLTPTGQLDPTFGTGGFTAIGPSSGLTCTATAIDGAGRIYVSWTDDPYIVSTTHKITRLTANGIVDPTFGSGGTVTHAGLARSVVPADGKVLLYEVEQVPWSAATVDVTRLTDAGQPDPTYGTGGTARLDIPAISPEGWLIDHAVEVAAGPGGSLVVLTHAVTPDNPLLLKRLVLGRVTGAGVPDPTLGPGGLAFPFGPPSQPDLYQFDPSALAVGADGSIVVGGDRTRAPFGSALDVVRFLPDGVPDPAFGVPGYPGLAVIELAPGPVSATGYERLAWLGLDGAGRTVVVGDEDDPTSGLAPGRRHVVRLTTTGGPDPTFGLGGRTTLPAELVPASRAFTITGADDIVGGGSVASNDRICSEGIQTYACPDLMLYELRGA